MDKIVHVTVLFYRAYDSSKANGANFLRRRLR